MIQHQNTGKKIRGKEASESPLCPPLSGDLRLAIPEQCAEAIAVIGMDGTVLFVNAAFAGMHGYEPAELLGKNVSIFHSPEQMPAVAAVIRNIEETGSFDGEVWHVHRNGAPILAWMHNCIFRDKDGRAVGIIGTARDITPGREEARTIFERLYDYAPVPYHTLTPDGTIVKVNRKWCEALGYDKDDVVGRSIFDFIIPEERETAQSTFERQQEQKIPFPEAGYERKFLSKSGDVLVFEINNYLWLDDARKVIAVLTTLQDVTERKKIEQDIRDANIRLSKALTDLKRGQDQMIQYERLAALGQMASGIAHNFNNVLMPILGFSDLMINNPKLLQNPDDVLQMVKDINTAAKDAKQAVLRLREFYRPTESTTRERLDINDVLNDAVVLTQPKWKDEREASGCSIEMRMDLHPVPPILAEESSFREVFVNIILNSVDAITCSGMITLRSWQEDKWVVASISDTGVGMAPEVARRCFDPFFTTKGVRGTGMGLCLAYGTVRRCNGIIEVASEPGKGTTFSIRLPAEAAEQPKQEQVHAARVPQKPLRIIVIDDEVWSRDLLETFLAADGHVVESADCGGVGLRKFETADYDLAIIDRAMPDMSGDDLAVAIKKARPRLPIILITGFGDMMREHGESPPGIDCILSKPVTQQELRDAVASVFSRRK